MTTHIKTNKGTLISIGMFKLSETSFVNAFPDNFKMTMFNNCNSVSDCNKELKALYAIHGQNKKKDKKV